MAIGVLWALWIRFQIFRKAYYPVPWNQLIAAMSILAIGIVIRLVS